MMKHIDLPANNVHCAGGVDGPTNCNSVVFWEVGTFHHGPTPFLYIGDGNRVSTVVC